MTWSVYGKSLGRTYILVILQLEVTFKLQSKQRDIVSWGRKWLANFNAGNTQPISLDISIRVLPSYRNQSIDLHSKSGFYRRATLVLNGLKTIHRVLIIFDYGKTNVFKINLKFNVLIWFCCGAVIPQIIFL